MARWDWLTVSAVGLPRLIELLNRRLKELSRALAGADPVVILRYGATVTIDASLGSVFQVTATDGNAFLIANPANLLNGHVFALEVANGTGGALGAITWGSLFRRDASFAAPAAGKSRLGWFLYDGTAVKQVAPFSGDV